MITVVIDVKRELSTFVLSSIFEVKISLGNVWKECEVGSAKDSDFFHMQYSLVHDVIISIYLPFHFSFNLRCLSKHCIGVNSLCLDEVV